MRNTKAATTSGAWYWAGAAIMVAAALLGEWVALLTAGRVPFITLFPAVFLVAVLGGAGPGLVALTLAMFLAAFLYMEPRWSFAIGSEKDLIAWSMFGLLGLLIVVMGSRQRRLRHAQHHADEAEREKLEVLNTIEDGCLTLDRSYRFVYVNPAAERQLQKSSIELAGKVVWEVYPQIVGTPIEAMYRRTMEEGVSGEIEVASQARAGRQMEVRSFASAKGITIYFRDVTDRWTAEQRIKESEAQLRLVTDSLPVLISYVDAEERYRFNNRTYEEWFGHSAEELRGRTLLEVLGKAAYERVQPLVKRALAGERTMMELQLPYRDAARHVSVTYVPDRDDDGHVRGYAALVEDVTIRKNVEARNEFLVKLSDTIRPLADPEAITHACATLLGEHLGVDRCAYADVADDQDTFDVAGDYTANGVSSIVGRYRFRDFGREVLRLMRSGKPYVIADIDSELPSDTDKAAYRKMQIRAVICVPLHKAGRLAAVMAVHQNAPRDWTPDEVSQVLLVANRCWESIERARALRNLREAEQRLRFAQEAGGVGTYEYDLAAQVSRGSHTFYALFGYPTDSPEMDRNVWEERVHPDDRRRIREEVRHVLTTGSDAAIGGEYRVLLPDGGLRWVQFAGKVHRDTQGTPQRIVGTVIDITERRVAEESARRSLAELRAVVGVMYEGVITADPSGNTIDWNPAALALNGYKSLEDARHPLQELSTVFHLYTLDGVELPMSDWPMFRILRGESFTGLEYRLHRSDIDWNKTISYSGVPVRDEAGNVTLAVLTLHDVTEQRAAEQSIRESRERLRLALEASRLGDWVWNVRSDDLTLSERAAEIFGLPPASGITWAALREMLHEQDRERTRQAVEHATIEHTDYLAEYRVVRPDGRLVWVLASGRGTYADDGHLTGMIGVVQDITDRKRDEELIRLAAERQSFLVRLNDRLRPLRSPEQIMTAVAELVGHHTGVSRCCYGEVDADERYIVVESDFTNGVASVRGRHLMDAFGPELVAAMRAGRTAVISNVATDLRTSDAALAWEQIDVRAIVDIPLVKEGKMVAMFVLHDRKPRQWTEDLVTLMEDVAERTWLALENARSVQAVRDGEARFRQLAETIPQLAWCARPDGRIFWYNRRWYEYTGTTSDEMDGFGWERVYDPAARTAMLEKWRAALASGEPWEDMIAIRRHDGQLRPHLSRAAPLRDDAGRIMLWFGTNTDVTDQQRLLAERERLLASEQAAREQAQHESRLKDEFLATLSHELRTPLNAILGWSQLIGRGEEDDEETREGVEIIERNARMQARLIEDLLDMSRIISGKIRLDMQRLDPAVVIDAAYETVRPAAEAKGVSLQKTLDTDVGVVAGDPGRLQQVVWNLLNNAVKFSTAGGHVHLFLQRVDSHVKIAIHDTGEGIDPEFLPHVFDRFRQADASTSRRHGGLGLGLSIARQLVELHGGSISAASEGLGKGSSFVVTLPLVATSADSPTPTRPQETVAPARQKSAEHGVQQLCGVKVLVVDDDDDARDLAGRVLQASGADVTLAATAREALDAISRLRPAVLVSDIGMPGTDGYELIRQVRLLRVNEGGATPAVALTAFARGDDRRRAFEAGYQMHLSKPVEPVELIATVANLAGVADRTGHAAQPSRQG